jgi:hypothetical protein
MTRYRSTMFPGSGCASRSLGNGGKFRIFRARVLMLLIGVYDPGMRDWRGLHRVV